jgi:hypothetical protein
MEHLNKLIPLPDLPFVLSLSKDLFRGFLALTWLTVTPVPPLSTRC